MPTSLAWQGGDGLELNHHKGRWCCIPSPLPGLPAGAERAWGAPQADPTFACWEASGACPSPRFILLLGISPAQPPRATACAPALDVGGVDLA
jgi:hypothetical protein